MGTVLAALIAVCGVLLGAFVTNFVAEDYRKYRQRIVLAAGLAGELESNSLALPLIRETLQALHALASNGQQLKFPSKFDIPSDPIYEKSVGELGLLGQSLTRDTVFTYQNIRAFRIGFATLCNGGEELPPEVQLGTLQSCMMSLDRAAEKASPLLAQLTAVTQESYKFHRGVIRLEILPSD